MLQTSSDFRLKYDNDRHNTPLDDAIHDPIYSLQLKRDRSQFDQHNNPDSFQQLNGTCTF
ncbi:hypothetical protein SDC9_78131 [bioreactor metagenome]|uniref:Uncharacterized protein n=1 Tax=bioreactor metagenome TaxID=1076179 RepID=A0A644YSL5_9ZZZZ